jgi:hypothetical protein
VDAEAALVQALRAAKSRIVRAARAHGKGLIDDATWQDTAAAVIRDAHCCAGLLGCGNDPGSPAADFADGPSRMRVEAAIDLALRQADASPFGVLSAIDRAVDTFRMEEDRRGADFADPFNNNLPDPDEDDEGDDGDGDEDADDQGDAEPDLSIDFDATPAGWLRRHCGMTDAEVDAFLRRHPELTTDED